VIKVFQLYVRP